MTHTDLESLAAGKWVRCVRWSTSPEPNSDYSPPTFTFRIQTNIFTYLFGDFGSQTLAWVILMSDPVILFLTPRSGLTLRNIFCSLEIKFTSFAHCNIVQSIFLTLLYVVHICAWYLLFHFLFPIVKRLYLQMQQWFLNVASCWSPFVWQVLDWRQSTPSFQELCSLAGLRAVSNCLQDPPSGAEAWRESWLTLS